MNNSDRLLFPKMKWLVCIIVLVAVFAGSLIVRYLVGQDARVESLKSPQTFNIIPDHGSAFGDETSKETRRVPAVKREKEDGRSSSMGSSEALTTAEKLQLFKGGLTQLIRDGNESAVLLEHIVSFMTDIEEADNRSNASSLLMNELRSVADFKTGLVFQLSRQGEVVSWPSYKSVLLDVLITLDARSAANYAVHSLQQKESSDLVSIAFQAVKAGSTDVATFEEIVVQSMTYEPWIREGNPAFLNGFDALVYLNITELSPEILSYASGQYSQGVTHAAYLTAKRLIQQSPGEVMAALANNGSLAGMKPSQRAEFHALLDPGDPEQFSLIQGYLSNASLSTEELKRFVGYFPNLDVVFTRNILSQNSPPQMDERIARLVAANDSIALLSNTHAFQDDPREFEKLRTKLEELIRSAERGGHI